MPYTDHDYAISFLRGAIRRSTNILIIVRDTDTKRTVIEHLINNKFVKDDPNSEYSLEVFDRLWTEYRKMSRIHESEDRALGVFRIESKLASYLVCVEFVEDPKAIIININPVHNFS
jgi:hypothetical protein